MNQLAYQEITKMINGFPQSAKNVTALLLTYEEDLQGISDQAICETAQRYRRNEIPEQNKTFAPSIAEFVDAARKQIEFIAIRERPRLPDRRGYVPGNQELPGARERMRLKMPLYQYANELHLMDELDAANREGFGAMVNLATKWGIEIPQELLDRPDAEDEWYRARNRSWSEIERNPPPFMINRQRMLDKNANRAVLFEDITFEQFKKLSAAREIPVGASWVAALGIIYGPKPKVSA